MIAITILESVSTLYLSAEQHLRLSISQTSSLHTFSSYKRKVQAKTTRVATQQSDWKPGKDGLQLKVMVREAELMAVYDALEAVLIRPYRLE